MATAPSYRSKWPIYAKQWDAAELTRPVVIRSVAEKLYGNKDRYLRVEQTTGVPWYMIAALHHRESSANFRTQLAQGDPLNRVSVHIPRGRGPFQNWEEGAHDALVTLKGLNKIVDWRLEKILYHSEAYNGWGYHWRGLASPYIWAGTSIQQRGKFVADGKFGPDAWDAQLGCAAMIRGLMDLDPSIRPVRET